MLTTKNISNLIGGASLCLGILMTACQPDMPGSHGKHKQLTVEEELALGAELYAANACNSCHGEEGLGNGPASATLKTKPRIFSDLENYKMGVTAVEIAETLESGIPGTAMVPYKHVSKTDLMLIARYVVSLQKRKGERATE